MIIVYTIESFLLCTFGHFPSNPHFPHPWGRSKKHGGMGLSDDSDCFPQAEGSEGLRETLLWATRRVEAFYPPGWGALPGGYTFGSVPLCKKGGAFFLKPGAFWAKGAGFGEKAPGFRSTSILWMTMRQTFRKCLKSPMETKTKAANAMIVNRRKQSTLPTLPAPVELSWV
jgi:hypothetical protein